MPSCACGGVRVCSLYCKRERDRHLQQHLKETHQILKKINEKKETHNNHDTTVYIHFI